MAIVFAKENVVHDRESETNSTFNLDCTDSTYGSGRAD